MHDITGITGDYNLLLPEVKLTYRMLNQPLVVNYEIVTDKTASGAPQRGAITGLSGKHALLKISTELENHTNLKIFLIPHSESESALYGKIMAQREDGNYEINFTSVPKGIFSVIEQTQ